MTKVNYITYTEPENNRSNNVRIYVREFETNTKLGKSKVFEKKFDFIIPSKEIKENTEQNANYLIDEFTTQFPQITFKKKHYSDTKSCIWALVPERNLINSRKEEEKIVLPRLFLTEKASFSQQLRFFYSPFTLVDIENGGLKLPEKLERSIVDLDSVLEDKKCALDIETMDYDTPNERISNACLNFGSEKYILTTFKTPFDKYRDYNMIRCKDTDEIKSKTASLIAEKDPLILYGYNIQFDQSKLRDLGEEEYLPGVGETKPIFKSVQGLKNMITRGRFTLDLYGYLFMFHNIYENNKLETHARMSGLDFKKDLPYSALAVKTRLGENGSVKDMEEVLGYICNDGNVTYELGEKYLKNIIQKSRFVKREPSVICTTSGKNIMKEYWNKRFFLKMNTYKDRYEKFFKEDKFVLENYKDEFLALKRKNGLFEDVAAVYPLLFIKSLWDSMLTDTTENLRFNTPEEKFESYQTLNEYICNAIKEYNTHKETIRKRPDLENMFNFVMKQEYGIGMKTIEQKLNEESKLFNELLQDAGLINYSKKFLYVKDPRKIEDRKLGFVFGKGNMLSYNNKSIMLINDGQPKLIYQGIGISKGKKSRFDADLMMEFLMRRLKMEPEEGILYYLKDKIKDLREGKIPREKLLTSGLGMINGKEVNAEEFLTSNAQLDYNYYSVHFFKTFGDILSIDFKNRNELKSIFLNEEGFQPEFQF
jgi:hypothetical protein